MFKSDQFLTAWQEWKKHFKEKTHNEYSKTAEEKALNKLWWKCNGREQLAIDSIDYSIEKNWNAVYLKPIINGYGNNFSGDSADGKKGGTSTDRMEAVSKW